MCSSPSEGQPKDPQHKAGGLGRGADQQVCPSRSLEVVTEELDGQDLSRRQKGSFGRAIAARMLCTYSGLSQREIGERLKWGTGAAVSMQMKKLRITMLEDQALQKRVGGIERRLRKRQRANG